MKRLQGQNVPTRVNVPTIVCRQAKAREASDIWEDWGSRIKSPKPGPLANMWVETQYQHHFGVDSRYMILWSEI